MVRGLPALLAGPGEPGPGPAGPAGRRLPDLVLQRVVGAAGPEVDAVGARAPRRRGRRAWRRPASHGRATPRRRPCAGRSGRRRRGRTRSSLFVPRETAAGAEVAAPPTLVHALQEPVQVCLPDRGVPAADEDVDPARWRSRSRPGPRSRRRAARRSRLQPERPRVSVARAVIDRVVGAADEHVDDRGAAPRRRRRGWRRSSRRDRSSSTTRSRRSGGTIASCRRRGRRPRAASWPAL